MSFRRSFGSASLLLLTACTAANSFSPVSPPASFASNRRATLPRTLFVGFSEKVSGRYRGHVASYSLPLTNGETPNTTFAAATLGVAAQSNRLYVTNSAVNANNNVFCAYKLPSVTGEKPLVKISLAGAYAIAASSTTLYVSSYTVNTVSSYALPLVAGETAAATIDLGGAADGNAIAVDSTHLYAANYASGTLSVFALPLTNGESPALSLSGLNTPIGLAVDRKQNLYVTSYSGSSVAEYKLPLEPGETPSVTLSLPGPGFGVAVDASSLYVTNFSDTLWAYALPISSGESPSASVSGLKHPNGVAAIP